MSAGGLVVMTYSLLLFAVNSRTIALTNEIEKRKNLRPSEVQNVMRIYSKLVDIVTNINRCLSHDAMLGFSGFAMNILFAMFSGYSAVSRGLKHEDLNSFYGFMLYVVVSFSCFLTLAFCSSNVTANGQKVWTLLGARVEKLKFAQIAIYQVQGSELIASCGLFNFGWEIVMGALLTAFTYTIVCIQFDIEN
jgi:hypothetical protein